jgi:hypothetical protein
VCRLVLYAKVCHGTHVGVALPRQQTRTHSCRSLLHAYAHLVVTCLCICSHDVFFVLLLCRSYKGARAICALPDSKLVPGTG